MRYAIFLVAAFALMASAQPQGRENSRARSRSLIPQFNYRGTSRRINPARNSVQNTPQNENTTVSEPRIITRPTPGQEFVSFTKGDVKTQDKKEKNEIILITDPVPGEEFVSFASQNSQPKDSVVSAKDGELFYINLDNQTPSDSETTSEPFPEPEPVASTTESDSFFSNYDDFTTSTYDETTATESPDTFQPDIEILDAQGKKHVPDTGINDVYGKYFDESELFFEDEIVNDNLLTPAESRVKSKFEIKEVNGQLYEYEYRYYYDDETPESDYDVVGNIPDMPATTTTSAPPTAQPQTAVPRARGTQSRGSSSLTSQPQTAVPRTRGTQSRGSAVSTRGRTSASVPLQPETTVRQNSRGRTRGQAPTRSQAAEIDTRSRAIDTSNDAINNVNTIDLANIRLPTQTRFPPRVTPSSPVSPSQGGVSLFEVESKIEDETHVLVDVPSSTVSPATRSLMNLYALSQAADVIEQESSTSFPSEQSTQLSIDYENYYDDYDYATERFLLSDDATISPDYYDVTSTVMPKTTPTTTTPTTTTTTTTSTTTTTTTTPEPTTTAALVRGRNRNRFGNPLSRNRGRGSNRGTSDVATETTTLETPVPSFRRGSNRLSSAPSPSPQKPSSGFAPSRSRFRPSNNRFGSNKNEISSTVEESSDKSSQSLSASPITTTAAPARGSSRRFGRPRLSFKPNSRTTQSKKDDETTTEATKTRGRFTNRFSRNKLQSSRRKPGAKAAEEEEKTESDVASINVDTSERATSFQSSSTKAPGRGRPPSRSSGRRRFGRPSRFGVQNTAAAKEEKVEETLVNEEVSVALTEAGAEEKTTTARPSRGSGRQRPSSKLSNRFNFRSRGRGKTTEAPVKTTTMSADDVLPEETAEETAHTEIIPTQDNNMDETVTEEAKSAAKPGRRNIGRKRGSLFGRFRNKDTSAVKTTTKAPATTAARRKSSFSLRGRRGRPNRRNRGEDAQNAIENNEEPAAADDIANIDTIENELNMEGAQDELVAQASEDHVAIVAPEPEGEPEPEAIEPVAPTPVKEKAGKKRRGGISLLSRLRNRNRPDRS